MKGTSFDSPLMYRGVGLAVARRLLEEDAAKGGRRLRVCLACRNMKKAEGARQSLLADHPGAQVDLLEIDTSLSSSVQAAAREIQNRWPCRLSSPLQSLTISPSLVLQVQPCRLAVLQCWYIPSQWCELLGIVATHSKVSHF